MRMQEASAIKHYTFSVSSVRWFVGWQLFIEKTTLALSPPVDIIHRLDPSQSCKAICPSIITPLLHLKHSLSFSRPLSPTLICSNGPFCSRVISEGPVAIGGAVRQVGRRAAAGEAAEWWSPHVSSELMCSSDSTGEVLIVYMITGVGLTEGHSLSFAAQQ